MKWHLNVQSEVISPSLHTAGGKQAPTPPLMLYEYYLNTLPFRPQPHLKSCMCTVLQNQSLQGLFCTFVVHVGCRGPQMLLPPHAHSTRLDSPTSLNVAHPSAMVARPRWLKPTWLLLTFEFQSWSYLHGSGSYKKDWFSVDSAAPVVLTSAAAWFQMQSSRNPIGRSSAKALAPHWSSGTSTAVIGEQKRQSTLDPPPFS